MNLEVKRTITSIFMLPTLQIPKGELKENGFINAFIKDKNKEIQYENCVYLLFRPNNIDKFKVFLDSEYERTKTIIDDYDYDGWFVVVVYKLDEKFKRDFDLIKKGKYSKTSPDFQKLFPKVTKVIKNGLHKDEVSLTYRIFNKTPEMVKYWEDLLDVQFDENQEVWYAFIEEDESLTLEKLKAYV